MDLKVLYERWIEDGNFKQKAGSFMGIRILRQDPVENVFSFICTSNNNIQRITMMVRIWTFLFVSHSDWLIGIFM